MTRLFSAVAIGGIAGGSLVAGEPAISMNQAISMVTASTFERVNMFNERVNK